MAAYNSKQQGGADALERAEAGQVAPPLVQGVVVQATPVQPVVAQPVPAQATPVRPAPVRPPRPVHTVAVLPEELPIEELVVLNLRASVMCFAWVDAIFTAINVASGLAGMLWGSQMTTFGYSGAGDYFAMGVFAAFFLLGPLCGVFGAANLKRGPVSVYLALCILNTVYQVTFALLTPFLFFLLFVFVRIWITKIVCSFWSALGHVAPARAQELIKPDFLERREVRIVYW